MIFTASHACPVSEVRAQGVAGRLERTRATVACADSRPAPAAAVPGLIGIQAGVLTIAD
jgi:hypothetical protein